MDVEKTVQFILDTQARTEAALERVSGEIQSLTVSQARLAESTVRFADLVQQMAQENWQAHERYDKAVERHDKLHSDADERYRKQRAENEEFHREVEERFNALIKMMDEWIRNQGRRNGEPIN
jgi:hypothetical protein